MNIVETRYEIAISRIKEITTEDIVKQPYHEFFKKTAGFIVMLDGVYSMIKSGEMKKMDISQLEEINNKLFCDVYCENYEKSFANPTYARNQFRTRIRTDFMFLYTKNPGCHW